jgi:hypothetical protein
LIGLVFGFQVSNVDCLPEVFPGFCGSFQGLVWQVWFLGFECLTWIACLKYFLCFVGLFKVWLVWFGFPRLIDGTYQI